MPERIPTHRPLRLHGTVIGEARPNANERGYCSIAHRKWRQAVLLRDAWACKQCGMVSPKNHADHIVPVMAGTDRCMDGRSRYDVRGGQCLCAACHTRKTARDAS
jgi:5-methylcytosine-specific restriction endonuclease McrA